MNVIVLSLIDRQINTNTHTHTYLMLTEPNGHLEAHHQFVVLHSLVLIHFSSRHHHVEIQ